MVKAIASSPFQPMAIGNANAEAHARSPSRPSRCVTVEDEVAIGGEDMISLVAD
jgi:hypothetical protein